MVSSKFVSHKASILGNLDSRRDSEPSKSERIPQILVKLKFRVIQRYLVYVNLICDRFILKNEGKSEK